MVSYHFYLHHHADSYYLETPIKIGSKKSLNKMVFLSESRSLPKLPNEENGDASKMLHTLDF